MKEINGKERKYGIVVVTNVVGLHWAAAVAIAIVVRLCHWQQCCCCLWPLSAVAVAIAAGLCWQQQMPSRSSSAFVVCSSSCHQTLLAAADARCWHSLAAAVTITISLAFIGSSGCREHCNCCRPLLAATVAVAIVVGSSGCRCH